MGSVDQTVVFDLQPNLRSARLPHRCAAFRPAGVLRCHGSPRTATGVPALTPRLALKKPGDRIYLGPKVAGRYTLSPVTDPGSQVLFLSTGTGEAPHNSMVVELLRKGHYGPIVSVVSVRFTNDLGYIDFHRQLEKRFHNYHYLPLTTRESGPKVYLQDVIRRDLLVELFGVDLDPARTQVFLCGNPAMIGLPEWAEEQPVFPERQGVAELLMEREIHPRPKGRAGQRPL